MNSIDKLTEMFAKFPGIGPRQAKRFVYYILSRNGNYPEDLIRAIQNLNVEIVQCGECQRFFAKDGGTSKLCPICSDDTRDGSMLMLVPRDIDMESIEKSGGYNGYYFILGGVIPILEKEPEKRIRINDLQNLINKKKLELKEIILAMNANLDGENTAEFIKEKFKNDSFILSTLGRGLSTGAELEYADPETLKHALLHRTK
ncbi:MAG: recombination protein RecR [Candidatus Zambryskibacteria bacterium]|nr:recombination protein RecR [Candidatus Zambryskibacteria bacterium]